MTIRALDPQSEIPEFKICAVRARAAAHDAADADAPGGLGP
jgi:hypothetical protein